MSDIIENGSPDTGQAAATPVDAGQVENKVFHSYTDDSGKKYDFKNQNEVNAFIKNGSMMRSDYSRKTQELARLRKAIEEQSKPYKDWDSFIRSRPDVYSYLKRAKERTITPDGKYQVLEQEVNALKDNLKRRDQRAEQEKRNQALMTEKDRIFKAMAEKYPDFNGDSVMEAYNTLSGGDMQHLIETLYYANKGKLTPEEIEHRIAENASRKKAARLMPSTGSSSVTGGQKSYKSFDEAREAALERFK